MEKVKQFIIDHKLQILSIIVLGIMLFCFELKLQQMKEEHLREVRIMTAKQATDVNNLENQLKISHQNAQVLAEQVKRAQQDRVQPITHVTVQAPSSNGATEIIREKIEKHDMSLPPQALETTDRTVVAEQPENKDYQVGVYKINTYRNWYLSTGVGVNDDKVYIPVAAQRNFSKTEAVSVQLNLDPQKQLQPNGGQIMYSKAVNKLFGVF